MLSCVYVRSMSCTPPVLDPLLDPMLVCGSRVSASHAFPDPGGHAEARMRRCACLSGTTTYGKGRESGRSPEKIPGSLSKPFHKAWCMWTSQNSPLSTHLGE
jgi:hypothetical protein